MIPADIDPSLRTGEPLLESLDDGFSPPARDEPKLQPQPGATEGAEAMLGPKSVF